MKSESWQKGGNIRDTSPHRNCGIPNVARVWIEAIPDQPQSFPRWWFQIYFMFTPKPWGNDPFWIFFRWVETTNYSFSLFVCVKMLCWLNFISPFISKPRRALLVINGVMGPLPSGSSFNRPTRKKWRGFSEAGTPSLDVEVETLWRVTVKKQLCKWLCGGFKYGFIFIPI